MIFVANLRPRTDRAFEAFDASPAAYLLSTHRLSGTTRRYAEEVRAGGTPLYADNGSKEHIDDVIGAHRSAAREIATVESWLDEIDELVAQNDARVQDLEGDLQDAREEYQDLVAENEDELQERHDALEAYSELLNAYDEHCRVLE